MPIQHAICVDNTLNTLDEAGLEIFWLRYDSLADTYILTLPEVIA